MMKCKKMHGFLLAAVAVWSTACSPTEEELTDPRSYPFMFEKVNTVYGKDYIEKVDFEGDGRDDFFCWSGLLNSELGSVLFVSHELGTIDEANIAGTILRPIPLDLDHDGRTELAVPFHRNDSLFISFLDSQARKLFYIFLLKGRPRIDMDSIIPWDPAVLTLFLVDFDGDGKDELLSVISTQRAAMPRGFLVHTLPEGELVDSLIIGSPPARFLRTADYDNDGITELVIGTPAPYNHAVANGFSDEFSYIIVLELRQPLRIEWSKNLGKQWSVAELYYDDWDDDGEKEFLVYRTSHASNSDGALLQILEPKTWSLRQPVILNEPLSSIVVDDFNLDGKPELLAKRETNELWLLDSKFKKIRQQSFFTDIFSLNLIRDIDGDGRDDIFCRVRGGTFQVDRNLRPIAFIPRGTVSTSFSRGVGKPPFLFIWIDDEPQLMRRKPNRLYLYYRYRRSMLGFLGTLAAASLFMFVFSVYRENRIQRVFQDLVVETDRRGLVFLDANGCIQSANATARTLLGLSMPANRSNMLFARCISSPELSKFFLQTSSAPPHTQETRISVSVDGREVPIRAIFEPVSLPGKRKPGWLVTLIDSRDEDELKQAKTWSAMAQRVAHDIKNPLTSILLTLQRLQMEYRRDSPKKSEKYDHYTSRIIERIQNLRHMTRAFMKFVSLEEANIVETDFKAFVEQIFPRMTRNLPPDIEAHLKCTQDLKPVRIDQEQIQIVIENLITNAINAMPEGGKLSVSVHMQHNFQPHGHDREPQDYVVLEVMDTGVGIASDDLPRLFDHDFTTSETGSGLGLAIVKKIIEEHNGVIEVESELHVGSSFSIFLPAR